jgi:predicted acetyltransferase
LAWPLENNTYEIKFTSSVPNKRKFGIEEALLSLVLEYCKNKNVSKVIIEFNEAPM